MSEHQMSKRDQLEANDSDTEKDYIYGFDIFGKGYYCEAIGFFASSVEKGVGIINSKFLMAQSMLMLGRFDEAEQLLYQIETDDASLTHQIDLSKIISHILRGSYQHAFTLLDKSLFLDKGLYGIQKYYRHWSHAYLANTLGEAKAVNLILPEGLRTRSQLGISPKQIDAPQINLALMDYKSVDYNKTSIDIGDYIQTVAVMRHIARHLPDNALIDVNLDDDDNSNWQIDSESLKSSFATLRESWAENEQRHITSNGKIVITDRDCPWGLTALLNNDEAENSKADIEPLIWYPIFGWFAHQPFEIVPVIPLPSQYLPIFFSFHLNQPEQLNAAFIAYLKRFAPIGCRDITTRDLLMNQGIDAFFSGCVTTTLALAGEVEPSDELLDVDAHMKASAIQIKTIYPDVRTSSFDDNITESFALLRRFRNARKVITSRLNCYLPTRALRGSDNLIFIPNNKADTCLSGLIDIDDDAFDNMRDGLTDLLDKILGKIMAGDASPDDVYAYWRTLTMPLVEQSRRERSQYKPLFVKENKPVVKFDATKSDEKPVSEVPIALAFDANIADYVPALLNSIEANKSCDTRYIMLVRDLPDNKIGPIEKACKQSPIQWFAMDKFLQDAKLHLYPHLTVSCMDRLFLPELLPDIDKILYLDIDMIVEGDIAELYQTDLLDTPLAAKEGVLHFEHLTTFDLKHLPTDKLLNIKKSASVSPNMLSRHFNAGVLVASLEKMRQDNFTEQATQLAIDYQLNSQYVLNYYTADNYIKLSPIWNGFPHIEKLFINEQKIFHWANAEKPWHTHKDMPFAHIWQQYADMQD